MRRRMLGIGVCRTSFTKYGYPLGIMANRDGDRFVDEGADMRNCTYAMTGRMIRQQLGQMAFCV